MATTTAILLAAGESTRMGQLKALLPWNGRPLIEYQLDELERTLVTDTIVVLGHMAEQIEPLVRGRGARIVINPDYRRGRASSIRVGAQAVTGDPSALLILNVDQPRPAATLDWLIRDHLRRNGLITRPVYRRQHGHPPVLAGRLLSEVRQVSEPGEGLKEILRKHQSQIYDLEIDDPIVLLNLNSPTDYEAALRGSQSRDPARREDRASR